MAVANAAGCMSVEALSRLRTVKSDDMGEFLLRVARATNPTTSAAAIEALPGTLEDARCVEELGLLLDEAHGIPHGDERRGACLRALGEIRSPECIALAGRELAHLDPRSDPEYGSQLVALIQAVGDAQACATIEQYAERLRRSRPKDKLRARHFDGKIAEALDVAETLRVPDPPEQ